MKAYLQIIFFLSASGSIKAQQNYFVYIQTDNKQAFYIKMNDKVMSSSASGYVVIPKLTTGTYQLAIGFPKDQWPQQNIPLAVDKTDEGYLLKNFGDKGWGLYNIRTMEVTMNGASSVSGKPAGDADDIFTNALAGAANTTLTINKEPAAPVVVAEQEPMKTVPGVVRAVYIEKMESTNAPEGRSMIYIDHSGNNADTVRVFLPADAMAIKDEPVKENKVSEGVGQTPVTPNGNADPAPVTTKSVLNFNSDCRSNSTDEDFLKMRKKMASEKTDDDMVNTARKYFKTKCYSSEQIKNLGLLFLNDAGKYSFFDLAYAHVYDPQNYSSLQSQLTLEYYISRFRAMIRN